MKPTKPNLKSVVAKDNQLIGQMAKYELKELRLIAYCLAHYDSRKPDNRTIEATIKDLQELFKMTTKDAYGVVRQAVRSINRKPLEIETERTDEEWYIFSGFRYYKGEGRFEFKISPETQPLLLGLGGNFTRYRLGDVYQFKAASTWKLYEIMKRWVKARKWEVELDELRSLIGVAGKYALWSAFDRALLKPATKEINETSDIRVSYEKIKLGRRVFGLYFRINPKADIDSDGDAIDVKTDREHLNLALISAGLHQKTAGHYTTLAETYGRIGEVLRQLPDILKRAKSKNDDIPVPQYVTGTMLKIFAQDHVFEDKKKREARHKQARKWLKTLSDKDLAMLAGSGNLPAQDELKKRKNNGI